MAAATLLSLLYSFLCFPPVTENGQGKMQSFHLFLREDNTLLFEFADLKILSPDFWTDSVEKY